MFQHWGRYYLLVPIFGFVYSFLVISPWWIFGNFMAKVDLVDGKLHTTVNPVRETFKFPNLKTQSSVQKSLFMHSTINYLFSLFYFLLIILVGVWTTITLQSRGKKSGSIRNQHFVQKLTKVIVCNSVLMSGNLLLLVRRRFFCKLAYWIRVVGSIKRVLHFISNAIGSFKI